MHNMDIYINKNLMKWAFRQYNLIQRSFSEITTPNKDFPGISKTVFTHASNLHGLLNDWMRVQNKSAKICKLISALKLHECNDDYYPQQLKYLTENLLEASESLNNIVEGVKTIDSQLQALAKLQRTDQPVILTWSLQQVSDCVTQIYCSLQNECRLKQVITENIAHCRDENLMEVYVSSWEFDVYLETDSIAYLFAEMGLPGIT